MAELLSGNRLDLLKSIQKDFLEKSRDRLALSNREFASLLGISNRTLTDWKRGKFLLPEKAAKFLYKKSGVKIPPSKTLNQFWYTKKGARKGGIAMYKKYRSIGDPEKRRKSWWDWWNKVGKFENRKIFERKVISKPKFSVDLAEFVGIVLGDGGLTKNQLTISLNRETDKDYIVYVENLTKKLFSVQPSLRPRKQFLVTNIVVSRTELVDFCKNTGLKVGNKVRQGVDIPQWVKDKKAFMSACVRGLVDTDGSVFKHKYRSNGKVYKYTKIDFSSSSKPLMNSVFAFLKTLGLRPRIVKDGKKLRIESVDTVKKYMGVIGTSNKKHLNRYNS